MTTDLLRMQLAEFGYALSFRTDALTECFASYESERWQGRGFDEDDALEDVLRQMLPSALARGLLERLPSSDAASDTAVEIPSPAPSAPAGAAGANSTPSALSLEPDVGAASSTNSALSVGGPVSREAPVPSASAAESAPGPVSYDASAGEEAHADPRDPGSSSANDTDPPTPSSSGNGTPTADSAPAANSLRIRAAAKTACGSARERNEEASMASPERGLVAVADGHGAQVAGDVASTMAIETLRKAFDGKEALSPARSKGLPMLVAAIERANAEIFKAGRQEHSLRGMGTTIAAALVVGRQVVLAHVGDSRVYRLRRGVLGLLTNDHSVRNDRIRSGKPAGAARRALTRALGARRTVEVETSVATSQPGDVLLLCTAGVHSMVENEALAELLKQHTDPEVAVEQLLARVNALGGSDNATAAVVRWER